MKQRRQKLQDAQRDFNSLHVCVDTLQCAIQGCVPCCYKILVYAKEPYARNQRPESCARIKKQKLPINSHRSTSSQKTTITASKQRIGLYSNGQRILTVGDGDLSFSASISTINSTPGQPTMIASSYQSKAEVTATFKTGANNIKILNDNNVPTFFNLDATVLDKIEVLKGKKFDRILWNFPCIESKTKADGQNEDMEANKSLLRSFFITAQTILAKDGEIHISHKTKPPYCHWDITALARDSNLKCLGRIVFDRSLYRGYQNRRTNLARKFPLWDAETFVFKPLSKETTLSNTFTQDFIVSLSKDVQKCVADVLIQIKNKKFDATASIAKYNNISKRKRTDHDGKPQAKRFKKKT